MDSVSIVDIYGQRGRHRQLLFFLLCRLIRAHFSPRNLNEVHSLSNIPLFAKYLIFGDKDVLLSIKKKLVEEL